MRGILNLPGGTHLIKAISGDFIYGLNNTGSQIRIIDHSNPADPVLVSATETGHSCKDIAVIDNFAYLASWDAGMRIMDVSDPENPILSGVCDLLGRAVRISVSNNHAFLATSGGGMRIVDTTYPEDLFEVGFFNYTPELMGSEDHTKGIYLDDNNIFLATPYFLEILTHDYAVKPNIFHLFEPSQFDTFSLEDFGEQTFTWESSIPPDSTDTLSYNFEISATISDSNVRTFNYSDIPDTFITLGIMDSMAFNSKVEMVKFKWHVEAICAEDTVNCIENYRFVIGLESNVRKHLEEADLIPDRYCIESLYPNPFNSTLSITVGLPEKSDLCISLYNILGQEAALMADGTCSEGYKTFTYEAYNLPSGIYFIYASVPGKMGEVRKVVLMK
ncbi:MAG: T9SS type A sorting domain-containing protein [Candidatus Electryonea clarkiae]|nr:T9SS type A sorting domain-containing protein [Candidatus Electryonea clarkiae]MDP8287247.1 T9SS type A sorting domain-containing protein [Candidatus Electryonea clarkiae]